MAHDRRGSERSDRQAADVPRLMDLSCDDCEHSRDHVAQSHCAIFATSDVAYNICRDDDLRRDQSRCLSLPSP